MKKNIIKSFFIVAIVAVASINISLDKNSKDATNLLSLNKKALASPECDPIGHITPAMWNIYWHTDCHWECTPGGSNYCPI